MEFRRVVVLSDIHFGERGALLEEPRVVDALLRELEELGGVDLLVLLGDTWDLWKTGLREAHAAGSGFYRRLRHWRGAGDLAVVAGNHDYHLALLCAEEILGRVIGWRFSPFPQDIPSPRGKRRGATGSAGNPLIPLPECPEKCFLEIDGLRFRFAYPFLSLRVSGKDVLLMHGHHLDFFTRSFWWAKTAWLARWVLGRSRGIALSDIDRLNRPFFEILTGTAVIPEIRRLEYGTYRLLRLISRLLRFQTAKGRSPRRYTSVGENRHEAKRLLSELLPGHLPDIFVFGHTHRAGLEHTLVGERPVLLANPGCWLEEEDGGSPGTYLILDGTARLRRLSDWEIEVAPGNSPQIRATRAYRGPSERYRF
ncbi:MAG: metallophosphoesterase [Actinomycetota bacterium]